MERPRAASAWRDGRGRVPLPRERGAGRVKGLAEAALVGLARAGSPPADGADPGDLLLGRAGDVAAERAFLLRLGIHAIRSRAGMVPATGTDKPQQAPPEVRPLCSPALAAIVADL